MGPTGRNESTAPVDILKGVFCLDFEASSLNATGYPIEVGIAEVESGLTLAWLIQPTPEWHDVGIWDDASQAVHGIAREELKSSGMAPARVAKELTDILAGKRVLSDNVGFDTRWLRQLYAAAGVANPPFVLEELEVYAWHVVRVSGRLPHVAFRKAEIATRIAFPVLHRAGPDAQHNAELLRQLCGRASPAMR